MIADAAARAVPLTHARDDAAHAPNHVESAYAYSPVEDAYAYTPTTSRGRTSHLPTPPPTLHDQFDEGFCLASGFPG